MNCKDIVFVALDNMNTQQINQFLSDPQNTIPNIKIGLELFCKYGPTVIKEISDNYNRKIFLDLKLHDIPNTVKKSIKSLQGLQVDFLTLHLSGGEEMIKSAIDEASKSLPNTKLLGVSYLTSIGREDFQNIWGYSQNDEKEAFKRLFTLASKTKIHGIVLSAKELLLAREIENSFNHQLIKVCPGIRFQDELSNNSIQDQKRVESPESALKKGANYLVMGRPITQAKDLAVRIKELEAISL